MLAGGEKSRLEPMTNVMNKHVLPIYDQPMIYYPVSTLVEAGVEDIMIISDADNSGKYTELLENVGKHGFDADFTYKIQSEPKGIAHAVSLGEQFIDDEFVVVLGDNIILENLSDKIDWLDKNKEARIFLRKVSEPSAYGVASVNFYQQVTSIRESAFIRIAATMVSIFHLGFGVNWRNFLQMQSVSCLLQDCMMKMNI